MKKRNFIASGLAATFSMGFGRAESAKVVANSLSPLKKKLAAGQSATLLIISDSTGYLETSGTRKFIRWLAAQYPAHRTTELYWAEWAIRAATGPKEYGAPIVLSEGTSQATLTICNAVLPGAFGQAMIDGSRWGKMLAPLPGAAPDLVLWNHGHNHQANIGPNGFAYGRGTLFAPLGRVGLEYPPAPHAALLQNPWRDNDGYDRVRDWWHAVAAATPSLTLVDGHQPFLDQGKNHELYKDNVHPNDRGYELIHQQLVAAWEATSPGDNVPAGTWATERAEPLQPNGDFGDWNGDLPKGWQLVHNGRVRKDTEHTYAGAGYSLALTGTTQNDGVQLVFTKAALAQTRGKTVSIAVLCFVPSKAEQDLQVKFTTNSTDQVTGSIQFARDNWKWVVFAGCTVPAEATLALVGLYRSFAQPPGEVPFYIQRVVVVEGDAPRGLL